MISCRAALPVGTRSRREVAMNAIGQTLEVVQWVAITVIGALLLGVMHELGAHRRRLGQDPGPLVPTDGLPLEGDAPSLVAPEVRTGRMVQLADYRGRDVVVAFLSPTCDPCINLAHHLNLLAKQRKDVPVIVVVAPGAGFDYAAGLGKRVLVVADPAGELQTAYEVKRMPLAYVIEAEGKVAMRVVPRDLTDLEDMLDRMGVAQGNKPWVVVEPSAQHGKV